MISLTPRLDLVERNLIINGNFDFWQRAISITGITSTTTSFAADRMRFAVQSATAVYRIDQDPDVPTFAQSGFNSRYSLKMAPTTQDTGPAVNSIAVLSYRAEGQDIADIVGRRVRIQFWVKSNLTGIYSFGVRSGDATRSYVTTYTVSLANTWEKKTIDVLMDTPSAAWPIDSTQGMQLTWALSSAFAALTTSTLNVWQTGNLLFSTSQVNFAASTSNTFKIAQVQLIPQDFVQAGPTTVDISFQRCGRSIGHELTMCQRYCETSQEVEAPFFDAAGVKAAGTLGIYWNGNSNSGTLIPVYMRVQKRVAPVGGAAFGSPTVRIYSTTGAVDNVRDNSALVDRAVSYTGNGANYNSTGFSVYVPTAVTGAYQRFYWICDTEL